MRPLFLLLLLVCLPAAAWQFKPSLVRDPVSIQRIQTDVRAGRYAHEFTLHSGACGSQPGWSDCANDRERVEMSQRAPWLAQDQEQWYSWSIKLAQDWPDISPVTVTLGQFHHRDSSTPAVLFEQRDQQLWLRMESAAALRSQRRWPLITLDHMRAQWVDIVVRARWSRGDQGLIQVWVNGQERVLIQGVTTLGTTPLFFKWGIYRSWVSRRADRPPQRAIWDEVRMGPTRESVWAPGLKPVD